MQVPLDYSLGVQNFSNTKFASTKTPADCLLPFLNLK